MADGRFVFLRARGDDGVVSRIEIGDVGSERHAAQGRPESVGGPNIY